MSHAVDRDRCLGTPLVTVRLCMHVIGYHGCVVVWSTETQGKRAARVSESGEYQPTPANRMTVLAELLHILRPVVYCMSLRRDHYSMHRLLH
jgi:hypothetical protein